MIAANNTISPYIIDDSLIYSFGEQLVQIGPISVKDISIHDLDVPEIIIFRPHDYLSIEFNFFHMLFVHGRPLTVYALEHQIAELKKVMQISLFAGDHGWALKRLREAAQTLHDEDRMLIESLIQHYISDQRDPGVLLEQLSLKMDSYPRVVRDGLRLFLNQELSLRAFAVAYGGKVITEFEEFPDECIHFISYREGEPIDIGEYTVRILGEEIDVSARDSRLSVHTSSIRYPTQLACACLVAVQTGSTGKDTCVESRKTLTV
jgi:hypothetical protein